jgi:hypothetical protein
MANYIFKAIAPRKGKQVIKTNASNREQAIQNICNAENCPASNKKTYFTSFKLNNQIHHEKLLKTNLKPWTQINEKINFRQHRNALK